MTHRYASLCTGIGGFDLGFDSVGMECVYQCEHDRHCLSVLNRHWPRVPKCTDVNDGQIIADLVRLRPDVIAFGSPCQDLSVAGRRGGLAAERSGLFFRCVECCFACEAPWVVWENVPGVFTSRQGEDFASVLEAFTGFRPSIPHRGWRNSGVCVGPLYSVAWSVLDAQWFGVPQSRDRVFIVGSLGDRAGPYEILSLADSVPWNSPPRREAGTEVTRCLARGSNPGRYDGDSETFAVASALEDGTGRGTPIIPVDYTNGIIGKDVCGTLEAAQAKGNRGHGAIVPIPFDTTQITSRQNSPKPGSPCHPLASSGHPPAIAFNWQAGGGTAFDLGCNSENTGALSGSTVPAVAYTLHGSNKTVSTATPTDVANSIRTKPPGSIENSSTTAVLQGRAVRRLTPLECERLQGFPDYWTLYGDDGKQIADSPRYKMLGNAVNVKVAKWIGRQLIAEGLTQ